MTDIDLRTAAQDFRAWPYEEARKLLKRHQDGAPVLHETGYVGRNG